MHTRKRLFGLLGLLLLLGTTAARPAAAAFDPSQLSLLWWLKGSAFSGQTNNATLTSGWTDSGPNAFTFALPSAGATYYPAYLTSAINGLPGIKSNPTYMWLDGPTSAQVSAKLTGGAFSITFVLKGTDTSFAHALLHGDEGGGQHWFCVDPANNGLGTVGDFNTGLNSSAVVTDGSPHIVTFTTSAPSAGNIIQTVYIDGTQSGALTHATTSASGAQIQLNNSGVYSWQGTEAEVVAVDHVLTASERQNLEYFEAQKYAISGPIAPATGFTAPSISRTWFGQTFNQLATTAPVDGVGPYTYQWSRNTATGATPPGGSVTLGAALTQADSGLAPGTTYYYWVNVTDTGQALSHYAGPFTAATLASDQVGILHVGDSITILNPGSGTSAGNEIAYLSAATGKRFFGYNAGQLGTTTFGWMPGGSNLIGPALTAAQAQGCTSVSLMLGANDCTSVAPAAFGTQLASVVNYCTTRGMTVTLNYPTWRGSSGVGLPALPGGTVLTNLVGYQAQIDNLVNGTTVLQGDRLAYSAFKGRYDLLAQYDGLALHPTVLGTDVLARLWTRSFLRAMYGMDFPRPTFQGTRKGGNGRSLSRQPY